MLVNRSTVWWRWVVPILLMCAGGGLTVFLSETGFNRIIHMRQLERLPTVAPSQVTIAESAVEGRAMLDPHLSTPHRSPHFKVESIYYRFLHEREERCGDSTCWKVIQETIHYTPFNLEDPITGEFVLVNPMPTLNEINWEIEKSASTTSGNNRYTEWRLEPLDHTFVLGYADWNLASSEQKKLAYIKPTITVGDKRNHPPIITNRGRDYVQSDMGGDGALLLAASLSTLCIAVLGGILLLRIHGTLVFLSLCSLAMMTYLVDQSFTMIRLDTVSGIQRYNHMMEKSHALLREHFKIDWQGFNSATPVNRTTFPHLSPAELGLYETFRFQLALAHARLMHQTNQIPDKWLVKLWDIPLPTSVALSESEQSLIQSKAGTFATPPLRQPYIWYVVIASFLLMILLTYRGIKRTKHKRMVENIATTATAGVVPGVSELRGTAAIGEHQQSVQSKLNGIDCIWFHYLEEEKISSGKKTRWRTVENISKHCIHQIEDQEGRLTINPAKAEMFSKRKTKKRQWRRRFTETWIAVGDPLYALGPVTFKTTETDAYLVMENNEEDFFILSNHTESNVMQGLAFSGFFAFTLALGFANLTFFTLNAYLGSFSAMDFLFACMITPLYLLVVTFILHYNDIVFLQKRVHRNKANIDVSLHKRKDLILNLEKLVVKYMEHERELQKKIAQLRTTWKALEHGNEQAIHRFVEAERTVTQQTLFRLEAYPALKASPIVKELMSRFTVVETEIALLRQAYNDAVEIYNTRINSIPDILYKKWLGFNDFKLISDLNDDTIAKASKHAVAMDMNP